MSDETANVQPPRLLALLLCERVERDDGGVFHLHSVLNNKATLVPLPLPVPVPLPVMAYVKMGGERGRDYHLEIGVFQRSTGERVQVRSYTMAPGGTFSDLNWHPEFHIPVTDAGIYDFRLLVDGQEFGEAGLLVRAPDSSIRTD